MRYLILTASAGLMLATLSLPVSAQALYRWVDSNGVVHYSDSPPADTPYETRSIRNATLPKPEDDVPPPTATAASGQPNPAQAAKDDPARQRNCEQARLNLELLQSDSPVRMDLDGDGEAEPIEDAARQLQIDLARRQVASYCD